ncbi:MAG: phospholipase D-like domain-containing protein [Bacteroidota bacterium]
MKITLLGQGYEAASELSVGKQLLKFFASKDFHQFTGISAFTSQAGVRGLSKHIAKAKKRFTKITIVTGVDQKGTSKEALEALFGLKIEAFVFYQPSFTIFHPKIYLFEGDEKSELIVGSSNLTAQGLFSNVEASILFSLDNRIKADSKMIRQLKAYFNGIFDLTDPNLRRLSRQLITDLVEAKVVPTEAERKRVQDKASKTTGKTPDTNISKLFPKRATAKLPSEFRGKAKATSKTKAKRKRTLVGPVVGPSTTGKLVWIRKALPSSSVQGGGVGTNPTGGLRLVQDHFEVRGKKISQTKYFRYTLFGKYTWKTIKELPFVEAARIPFGVTILGDYKGRFELEIRHKPTGEAGQHNYTTSISWGELGETIRESNLTGTRLELYAPPKKGEPFHIVISQASD